MAARTLDRPAWNAGQRMMNIAAREGWQAIVSGDRIVTADRKTIEGFRKAAAQAERPVRREAKVAIAAPTS